MSYSSEYSIWQMMKQRCRNPKNKRYPFYGARGISVCDRWEAAFINFYDDMGNRPSDKHSLDRIDNNGNYSKENCKWSTQKEQCNNTRSTSHFIYKGGVHTMSDLISISGLSQPTLWNRINRIGMTVEEAVNTPLQTNKNIEYNGKSFNSLSELARKLGLDLDRLWYRINTAGMTVKDAVEKPIKRTGIVYKGVKFNSLRSLAVELGVNHNTLYCHIAKGKFVLQ